MLIFLNCFVWNINAKECKAQVLSDPKSSQKLFKNKSYGVEISQLSSWKNCSSLSWQTLQTFFKQSCRRNLKEVKWKADENIVSNSSFTHISSLVEKISELRKCRINSKIQLEEIMLSGVKSYFLESTFPKICSLQSITNNSLRVTRSNALCHGKFQIGGTTKFLKDYFPGLKDLSEHSNKISIDGAKGFTVGKFLACKGSPFFKKILGSEYSAGYNIPLNSSKATEIFLKNVHPYLHKQNFCIKLNKDAEFFKLENCKKKIGLKIIKFSPCMKEKFIIKEKYHLKQRMWDKKFNLKNYGILDKIKTSSLILRKILNSNSETKESTYLLSHEGNRANLKTKAIIEMNSPLNFNTFDLHFKKSMKLKNDIGLTKKLDFKKKIAKNFEFEEFKKKNQLNHLASKDRIVRGVRNKSEKSSKVWRSEKIIKTFNFHTLCHSIKNFCGQKVSSPKNIKSASKLGQGFPYKGHFTYDIDSKQEFRENFKWIFHFSFFPVYLEKQKPLNEKIILMKKFQNLVPLNIYAKEKKELRLLTLNVLNNTMKENDGVLNYEIFKFSKSLGSIKTEDWRTSISLLNKLKGFKHSKILSLLGSILRSGLEIPKSTIESRKYHSRAANLGNTNSYLALAFYYMKGMGIKKSKRQAFFFFSNAAHQGIPRGVYNLVTMLKNGIGVEKDSLRALKILECSKQLITKERRQFKKYRKLNKTGFFKTIYSSIRFPNEINSINFFLESFTSPLTSHLGSLIFEHAHLVSSYVNLINISEKKGSLNSQKKLKDLFLENRQLYLFHENAKKSTITSCDEITESILKLNLGIGSTIDVALLKNIVLNSLPSRTFFHRFKIFETSTVFFLYKSFYRIVKVCTQLVNFLMFTLIQK